MSKLTLRDVAAVLDITETMVSNKISKGEIPPPTHYEIVNKGQKAHREGFWDIKDIEPLKKKKSSQELFDAAMKGF